MYRSNEKHAKFPPKSTWLVRYWLPVSKILFFSLQFITNLTKSLQNIHDLLVRFAVGGDGKVYEGRGFNVVGAHAPMYNGRYFPELIYFR